MATATTATRAAPPSAQPRGTPARGGRGTGAVPAAGASRKVGSGGRVRLASGEAINTVAGTRSSSDGEAGCRTVSSSAAGAPRTSVAVGLVGRREGGREDERLLVGRGPGRGEARPQAALAAPGRVTVALLEGRHLQAHRLLVAETGEPGAEAVLEVLHEGARRLVSVLRLLGQDLVEDLAPLLRHEAVHLEVGRLDRVDVDELVEDRGDVGAGEGLHPREHLEGHDAEREDVAAAVERLPHGLLGRHVGRRPEQRPRVGDLGVGELGDAEVRDLDLVLLVEDEVGGLDVAVDDPARVGVVERRRDLAHEPDHLLRLEAVPLLEDGADRLAVHELHGEERHVLLLADVEEGDDARVGEGAGDARLLVEALLERPVLGAPRGDVEADRLDRQRPLDEGVEGLVDGSHRPEAEGPRDLVPADRGRDRLAALVSSVAHRSGRGPIAADTSPTRIDCSTRFPGVSNGRNLQVMVSEWVAAMLSSLLECLDRTSRWSRTARSTSP